MADRLAITAAWAADTDSVVDAAEIANKLFVNYTGMATRPIRMALGMPFKSCAKIYGPSSIPGRLHRLVALCQQPAPCSMPDPVPRSEVAHV